MYDDPAMNENSSTNVSTSSSHHGLTADQIAPRAYQIWEQEGRPENRDLHHWLRAEQELVAQQKSAGNTASATRTENNDTQRGGVKSSSSQPPPQQQPKKPSGNPFPAETAGGRFVQATPPSSSSSRSRSGGK